MLNLIKSISHFFFPTGKPSQVIIETTNHCNLDCPFCMVGMQNKLLKKKGNAAHSLMSREMGFMSQETFNIVLRELKNFGIKKAYLHFQGEPFLNKLTLEFAASLKNNRFWVGIFTNGLVFSDEIISRLADIEIDMIRFSIDGASQNSYGVNRVGGNFQKALENLGKICNAHKGKKTRIEWQFLVLRNNEHEIEKAKEMAEKAGAVFFTKGFRETDPELAPDNPNFRAKFLQKPCTDIYKQLGIYWNGDVVPCCYDVDGREIMGNLLGESLINIWNSGKYRNFREKISSFKKNPENEPDICKSCLRWK